MPNATSTAAMPAGLIDCDVHNTYNDDSDIVKHLPSYYRQMQPPIQMPGRAGLRSPIAVLRHDAVPDEAGKPGSSVPKMREQCSTPTGSTTPS